MKTRLRKGFGTIVRFAKRYWKEITFTLMFLIVMGQLSSIKETVEYANANAGRAATYARDARDYAADAADYAQSAADSASSCEYLNY